MVAHPSTLLRVLCDAQRRQEDMQHWFVGGCHLPLPDDLDYAYDLAKQMIPPTAPKNKGTASLSSLHGLVLHDRLQLGNPRHQTRRPPPGPVRQDQCLRVLIQIVGCVAHAERVRRWDVANESARGFVVCFSGAQRGTTRPPSRSAAPWARSPTSSRTLPSSTENISCAKTLPELAGSAGAIQHWFFR